ncbi:MAG TPA: VWA domain-containing protein [Bryobacteraceae bacterium]|nr:VWA domain-containing protein [Bryobacteraceae bacterium]
MSSSHDVVRVTGVMLLFGAALAATGSQQTSGDEPTPGFTLRTTSRLVLLDVSVKDSKGGFVSGLTQDQFKVYEDGKPQVISQFSNADVPVTVGIVVDESGSMRPKRPEVLTAALEFIHASNPQDEMFVVNFNERARRGLPDLVPFSGDISQLRLALWQGDPEGRTALYDAIELAMRQLQLGRRAKQALVVISDGGDNVSKHTLTEVTNDLLNSLVTVYTVGIFDQDDPERNPGVLEKLAHISGGAVYFPKQLDQVIPICKQIAQDIRTRYTIGYIPPAGGKAVRHIKVVAAAPGHDNLLVRTRTSYQFSPESEAAATK